MTREPQRVGVAWSLTASKCDAATTQADAPSRKYTLGVNSLHMEPENRCDGLIRHETWTEKKSSVRWTSDKY